MSPRNRLAKLYPQALGSLFVSSHDLQSYGGDILTYLIQVKVILNHLFWYQATIWGP
jgi:hypothetical protein